MGNVCELRRSPRRPVTGQHLTIKEAVCKMRVSAHKVQLVEVRREIKPRKTKYSELGASLSPGMYAVVGTVLRRIALFEVRGKKWVEPLPNSKLPTGVTLRFKMDIVRKTYTQNGRREVFTETSLLSTSQLQDLVNRTRGLIRLDKCACTAYREVTSRGLSREEHIPANVLGFGGKEFERVGKMAFLRFVGITCIPLAKLINPLTMELLYIPIGAWGYEEKRIFLERTAPDKLVEFLQGSDKRMLSKRVLGSLSDLLAMIEKGRSPALKGRGRRGHRMPPREQRTASARPSAELYTLFESVSEEEEEMFLDEQNDDNDEDGKVGVMEVDMVEDYYKAGQLGMQWAKARQGVSHHVSVEPHAIVHL